MKMQKINLSGGRQQMAMPISLSYRFQGYNNAITLNTILAAAYPVSIRVIHFSYLQHNIKPHQIKIADCVNL